jgi:flagellar biosynthesis/type III secretory pathway chaperone
MDANSTGKTPGTTDLKSLLTAEHIGYSSLLETLQNEKRLLIERNFDSFAETLERKHNLVTQLDKLAGHRLTVLEALKLELDESGVQALIERQPEFGRQELINTWQEIKDLVARCNRQNEVNAKIAHRAQATSRQILNILKGAPLKQALYDKRGTPGNSGKGLSITRA